MREVAHRKQVESISWREGKIKRGKRAIDGLHESLKREEGAASIAKPCGRRGPRGSSGRAPQVFKPNSVSSSQKRCPCPSSSNPEEPPRHENSSGLTGHPFTLVGAPKAFVEHRRASWLFSAQNPPTLLDPQAVIEPQGSKAVSGASLGSSQRSSEDGHRL